MKQDNKRYKQLAGFPGRNTATDEHEHANAAPPPLTDIERLDMRRLDIPHEPEPPRAYTPPEGPQTRPMRIEWIGPLGLLAIVLFLLTWLRSIPGSGEQAYYKDLLSGKITMQGERGESESGEHESAEVH
jgi:hypothetical protein